MLEHGIFANVTMLQDIINFLGCSFFAFLGSLVKEIYNANYIEDHVFQPFKVLVGFIISSLVSLICISYFDDFVSHYAGSRYAISLIVGFMGFEIFYNVSSIGRFQHFYKSIRQDEEIPDVEDVEREQEEKQKNIKPKENRSNYNNIHHYLDETKNIQIHFNTENDDDDTMDDDDTSKKNTH